jgi:hypothetical protein
MVRNRAHRDCLVADPQCSCTDPPYLSFGLELPPQKITYNPWTDSDCQSAEELAMNFCIWVSSYYDHPDLSGDIDGLDYRKRTDERTISSWTKEQWNRYYCEPAAVRSERYTYVHFWLTSLMMLNDSLDTYDISIN